MISSTPNFTSQKTQRHEFLYNVLRDAPREVVQDVLSIIDQQDAVLEEHTEQSIVLLCFRSFSRAHYCFNMF